MVLQESELSEAGKERGRIRDYLDLYLVDHGFIRGLYKNRHRVGEKMYRSAQPSPSDVRKLSKMGIKTIINLRGASNTGGYRLEKEACAQYGIDFVDFKIYSRDGPKQEDALRLGEFFEGIKYPALLHCKSGADRASLMSALYLFVHEGKSLDEATEQLSFRFGHMKSSKTGILDYFMERIKRETDGSVAGFYEWIENTYDRKELKSEFKAGALATFFVDKVIRRE